MPDLDRVAAGLRRRDLLTRLADYVAGELIAKEVERVDAHLGACEYCKKFGGEYGKLVEELRGSCDSPTVDSDVWSRLANRMEALWESDSE